MSIDPSRAASQRIVIGQYSVQPYVADGGGSLSGAMQLVGILGFAGLIVGWIASFISRFFWLILLFPIGLGCILGFIGAACIRMCHIRNPLLCGLAGFLAGILSMLSMHYNDYQNYQTVLTRELGESAPFVFEIARNIDEVEKNLDQQDPEIQAFVRELRQDPEALRGLQVNSFPTYMDHMAHIGVELKKAGRGQGLNLGYYGSYIYWAVESLIVAGIAWGMMSGQAGEPYCVECRQWKETDASGPYDEADRIVETLQEGTVLPFIAGEATAAPDALVSVFSCPGCAEQGSVDVRIERQSFNHKGEEQKKKLVQLTFPGEALIAFQKAKAFALEAAAEKLSGAALLGKKTTASNDEEVGEAG